MHYYRSKLLIFLSITFILMPFISIGQTSSTENFKMPDTPAGRCADAYYKAFNSGENSRMQDFFEHYYSEHDLEERSIESRLKRYNQLGDIFKTLTPAHIGLSLDQQISLLCLASGTEDGIIFRFQLQDPQSNKIDSIR